MALSEKHLHPYSNFPVLSRSRLLVGIALGLLFAFSFYAFLCLSREAIRILFFYRDYHLLVLTNEQVHIYNLFFASISTIIGQSLCVVYWLDTSITKYGKYRFKVRAIINDQRNLNSYFLFWFSKMGYTVATVIGGLLMFTAYSAEDISSFNFILVLIVIVLFLHSWMNLRSLFLGRSLKWMLYSVIILTALSLGLSYINFVDYDEINRIALKRNVWHNYRVELPETDQYERLSSHGKRRGTIMFIRDKAGTTEPLLLFNHTGDRNISSIDFHQITLDSLCGKIKEGDESIYEEYMYEPFVVFIDKNIRMKYVNNLKNKLSQAGVVRVEYGVIPSVREYSVEYYDYLGLPYTIPFYYGSEEKLKEMKKLVASEASFLIDLKEQEEHTIMFNDSLMNRSDLRSLMKQKIEDHPKNYTVRYYIADDSPFSHYISVITDVLQAVNELRNDYSQQAYQQDYEYLEYSLQSSIRKEIPVKIWEITEEMDVFLRNEK